MAIIRVMEKDVLEGYLDQGLSLQKIGKLVGKDPSTVGYWVQKHGLVAVNRDLYAPRGGIPREKLEPLVDQDLSEPAMAERLDRSVSTIRYWLKKYGLKPARLGRDEWRRARAAGLKHLIRHCRHHGRTSFVLESSGYYRCRKCRSAGVAKRRRVVKRRLVEDAGGACQLCGYDRCEAALHFHHLDPSQKLFPLSLRGVTKGIATIRAEAEKCVLLCANCHAEVEAGVRELPPSVMASSRAA
jgi:hypothetical protein